ncbi:MAG: Nramp family divalent metal transporter [Armatimonadetes bacterium]|nr:Nramp family divalent metal transporter [Armatimonadota bacterium]
MTVGDIRRAVRSSRSRIALFLAVMGPGIITANMDNDAGGIATYSVAGAHYGYSMLWLLPVITFALIVVQEMCARMAAITGKGLADLIREEFGMKVAFWSMLILVAANFGTVVAEFAGITSVVEMFVPGTFRYVIIPLSALFVWLLVVKGTYRTVERVFLYACLVYLTYILSVFLVHPPWPEVIRKTFVPDFENVKLDAGYFNMVIALIGTSITPWMQFYLQSSVRDKGIDEEHYPYEKLDVTVGAISLGVVSFFIIVACAATLFAKGIHVESAKEAAEALRPVAGPYCSWLFAIGLFNASLFGAVIVPLSTAYAVAESLGWEASLGRRTERSRLFIWTYSLMIFAGASLIMFPKLPLVSIMVLSQTFNGVLLPVVLVLMLILVNRKDLMGQYTNSRAANIVTWFTVAALIILTGLLMMTTFSPGLLG